MALKRCAKGHYYDASKHTSCPSCGVGGLNMDNGDAAAPPRPEPAKPEPARPESVEPKASAAGPSRPMRPRPEPIRPPVTPPQENKEPEGQSVQKTAASSPSRGGGERPSPLRDLAAAGDGRTRARMDPVAPPDYNPTRRRGEAPPPKPAQPEAEDDAKTRRVYPGEMSIDPVVGWLVCINGSEKGKDFQIRSQQNFIGRSSRMHICIGGDRSISRDRHAIISFDPRNSVFKILPGESSSLVYLNGQSVDMPMELKEFDVIELGQTSLIFVPLCGRGFQWA